MTETTEDDTGWRVRYEDEAGFWSSQRLLKLLIGIAFFMFIALGVVFYQQAEIRAAQISAQERGYINRAQSCIVQVTQLGPESLSEECLDPNVLEYYDPTEVMVTLCANAVDLNVNPPVACDE